MKQLCEKLRSERSLPVPAEGECLATHTDTRRRNGLKPDYAIDHETGCWNWLKFKTEIGYPAGHAHRKYWERANGPIPKGWQIHHVCRNPSCVNPAHLEAMSRVEHNREHFLEEKAGLTFEDVEEIRRLGRETTMSGRDVAEQFGVSWFTVYRYWRGESWREKGYDGRIENPVKVCAREGCDNPVIGRRQKKWCDPACQHQAWRDANREKINKRAREAHARKKAA